MAASEQALVLVVVALTACACSRRSRPRVYGVRSKQTN
jgi:hypothetical protein